MGLVQCKTDPCVWKLVKETSQGPQLQVLVLFHIDDFMSTGHTGEAGWEEFQRRMHNKWKWSEWEQGHTRMTGVDVSQLQDGSFVMDQKAYVENIDPAEINLEPRKTPEASVTEQEKSMLRGLWGAMHWPCTQTDAKRACAVSMLQSSLPVATVGTLMKSNRILKEMKSDLVELRERVHAHGNERLAVVSGQMQHGPTGKNCLQRLVSFQELRQHESCKAEDMARLRFIIFLENRIEKQDRVRTQRCRLRLTQNKSYTSRDCKWQSFLDFL